MSSDKPPTLPIPTPPTNSTTSSPRTGGTSILNGSASNSGAQGGVQNGSKVKSDLNQSNPNATMQSSHVLPHPNMTAQAHNQYSSPHTSTPTGQYGYSNEYSQQGYPVALDFPQHHLSQPQQSSPQTATSGNNLSHFQGHQSHTMQPYSAPHTTHSPYPFHFPSPAGVSSPSGQPGMPGQMGILPLPSQSGMTPAPSPLTSVPPSGPQSSPQSGGPGSSFNGQQHVFDATGQIAPPGMKPRVTATLWEDEGSLCFQVEAKGVCVARREDNHMINGTKLLNVAGMTRGRRDGILKSEKVRHVVKIGPMHLKGVWIPFERALDFANKEKITEMLYPLFVHNIGALLYHPTNTTAIITTDSDVW
jgi:protein SOK2